MQTIDSAHGVQTSDGKAVNVHARPAATFREISKELYRAEITKGVGELFLVYGLREAETEQSLVDIRMNLVSLVKYLCDSPKVSSILPSAKPNERINLLNDLIWDACVWAVWSNLRGQ